jgi:hypothetical protein
LREELPVHIQQIDIIVQQQYFMARAHAFVSPAMLQLLRTRTRSNQRWFRLGSKQALFRFHLCTAEILEFDQPACFHHRVSPETRSGSGLGLKTQGSNGTSSPLMRHGLLAFEAEFQLSRNRTD